MRGRRLEPELLDELPAADPEAKGSRRDLKLLNRIMGHAGILSKIWSECDAEQWCGRIVDLGGGDATFLLEVARRVHRTSKVRSALLVDRQPIVSAVTLEAFAALGWELQVVSSDVFHWLAEAPPIPNTFTIANLFLHHFEREGVEHLLRLVVEQCRAFAACEPRRSSLSLTAAKLLGVIGCNRVTRHDARISVLAGFRGHELQEIWKAPGDWRLTECEVGLFSHLLWGRRGS
ncbi:MAG TPA: hypothetical protein VMZ27_14840 [Candidatus Saccharimonadales bacterium]|nr:hypothetical protein [Candidatus Saccharimonadales bacterium]